MTHLQRKVYQILTCKYFSTFLRKSVCFNEHSPGCVSGMQTNERANAEETLGREEETLGRGEETLGRGEREISN
jgi:hypothetical protein